jgi:hypothetical protein
MADGVDSEADRTIARGIERAFIEKDALRRLKKKRSESTSPKPKTIPAEALINITEESQEELYNATTVFPFTLFPHSICVDRQKISIIHRSFFRTANIISVKIGDVLNVETRVGPFFASLRIYSKYFVDNYHEMHYLTRNDAANLHKLLQGYMIANEKEIDCSKVDRDQLIVLLNELGEPSA